MNILFTALDFKSNPGGIAELTHQLAYHLHASGDAVRVLCQEIDGTADREFDSSCPYQVTRFDYKATQSRKIRRAISVYSAINNAVREHAADVIINNTAGDLASFCRLVSRRRRVPLCLFAHGLDVNRRVPTTWKLKQNIVLRSARMVFCNSQYTAGVVQRRGVPAQKTPVVHPGFSFDDLGSVTAAQRSAVTAQHGLAGRKVILSVGRLIERKGLDKMIEAMSLVRKEVPEALYLVAGDGPDRERLEEMAKNLNLADCVRFAGYISDEDKAAYYDVCRVFTMPSRELPNGSVEGFGIVFLEANAYEKPVVGGRAGGVVDAIEDGRSGILVNPTDVGEIASAITRLLRDETLAAQLGRYGRERVVRDFAWETIVSHMREKLTGVVSGARQPEVCMAEADESRRKG